MKRFLGLIPVLLYVLATGMMVGCKVEEDHWIREPYPRAFVINISGQQSLYLPPDSGSTVETPVTVWAHDEENSPWVGVDMSITLSMGWGEIIFLDSLGDTTDENGHVNLLFRTSAGGYYTIMASAYGDTARLWIQVLQNEGPLGIVLTVEPDTLWLTPQQEDSVRVLIRLQYDFGWPSPDTVFLSASVGHVDSYTVITNPYEEREAWWRLAGDYGTHSLFAYVPSANFTLVDTAWVTVLPPPVGQVRILATDTLRLVPGDTASTPVTVIVTGQSGQVLPGRIVNVALMNPSIAFLEHVHPQLGDTTDDLGRLQMLYYAFDVGMNWIIAACEGVSATDSIVTLWAP